MLNILLLFIVVLIGIYAGVTVYKKTTAGGGCCGEHEKPLRRISVKDRNPSHYPWKTTLQISGMTCENCAVKVENALNSLPETFASVRIDTKQAIVLTKAEPDHDLLNQTVRSAGYVVRP